MVGKMFFDGCGFRLEKNIIKSIRAPNRKKNENVGINSWKQRRRRNRQSKTNLDRQNPKTRKKSCISGIEITKIKRRPTKRETIWAKSVDLARQITKKSKQHSDVVTSLIANVVIGSIIKKEGWWGYSRLDWRKSK